jgi:hypothetical protein
MDGYVVHGSLGMTRGSVLRVEGGRSLMIYVWEGALRVTEDGVLTEHRLGPGEWLVIRNKGATVARALGRSELTLSAATPTHYARRIVLHPSRGAMPRVLYAAPDWRARWWRGLFAPNARPTRAAL